MKPILGPCDSYQLEPFIYPWAWEMSRAQEANTWSPEEIAVSGDMADYKSLNLDPAHRHLFESVMAQLTTFDILRGDDAAETLLAILQPAELKHFLKRMVWEEALHTRSYRYVIENLGIPLEIYERYKTVPAFKARVDMCSEISAPLFALLGRVYRGIDNLSELSVEQQQDILRSMVFYFLVFEGVWFWVSLLGPVQQLARLGRFKGAAEQFTYIARDESNHVGFGVSLIREYMLQYPACIEPTFIAQLVADVNRAIELEQTYIEHCLRGPILGYSVADHMSTTKFFANMRFGSVGLPQPYAEREAVHAFPWMSEAIELNKEKNFFETRVTEYQTSGALSFDSDHTDHDLPGWNDPLGGKINA